MGLYNNVQVGQLYFLPDDGIEELEQYNIYYILSKKNDDNIKAFTIIQDMNNNYFSFIQDYDDDHAVFMDPLEDINKKHYKNLIRTVFGGKLK